MRVRGGLDREVRKGGLVMAGDTGNGRKSVTNGIGGFVVGALGASRFT